jgi:hypothetical protein
MRLVDNELEKMYKQSIPGLMWNKTVPQHTYGGAGGEEV